ncbi:MAG TPA: hypothetical protein VK540_11370 [Polyangiaceae bacterium]|nr:hypothetical protein [Polyangiaceae bacterium]
MHTSSPLPFRPLPFLGSPDAGKAHFLGAHTAAVVMAWAALAGCSGDHDYLAQKNVDAGSPLDASAADARGDEGRNVAPPADVGEASPEDGMDASEISEPPEPPGSWTFTWTNGLVDAESARFCFVPVRGDQEIRDGVVAVPAGGLPFGKSLVLGDFRGVDGSTMGVHPYVVVGTAATDVDGGRECAALLDAHDGAAGDDGALRGPIAVSLPLIPAGTLVEGRSYLGVVTGCARSWPYPEIEAGADATDAADAGVSDAADGTLPTDAADAAEGADASPTDGTTMDVFRRPSRAAICGSSSDAPNAGLVLVRLSRREVGARFGFQAVHASAAVAGARIALERAGGDVPILSADIAPYQIVPRDGLTTVTRNDFGPSVGAATLRVASPVSAFPTAAFSLASALAEGDIDEAALVEGDRLSLVLIGAQPGQNPGPPWNAARMAIVRNAPSAGRD